MLRLSRYLLTALCAAVLAAPAGAQSPAAEYPTNSPSGPVKGIVQMGVASDGVARPLTQPSWVALPTTIAATNVAQALPNNVLVNGLACVALTTNAAVVYLGPTKTVTSSSGVALLPGQGWSAAISSSSSVWIYGNAGDVLDCWGS